MSLHQCDSSPWRKRKSQCRTISAFTTTYWSQMALLDVFAWPISQSHTQKMSCDGRWTVSINVNQQSTTERSEVGGTLVSRASVFVYSHHVGAPCRCCESEDGTFYSWNWSNEMNAELEQRADGASGPKTVCSEVLTPAPSFAEIQWNWHDQTCSEVEPLILGKSTVPKRTDRQTIWHIRNVRFITAAFSRNILLHRAQQADVCSCVSSRTLLSASSEGAVWLIVVVLLTVMLIVNEFCVEWQWDYISTSAIT